MPAALEISRLTVRRQGRLILDEVSLTVERASIHLLVGPNGAGKSSLLAAVLGQLPFTGEIQLRFARRGEGAERGAGSARPALAIASSAGRLAYVPQSFAADRTLPITVEEFLAVSRQRAPVCLGVRRQLRPRLSELLARVGLAGMERRRLGELSGGELRRVLIGDAIEPAPELLLCDEPSTGLDPEAIAELDRTLLALRERHGTTIVMVSHDLAQVRRLADRVSALRVKLMRTGTADEVLSAGLAT